METEIDFYDGVPLQQFITYRLARLHAKLNAQASRILAAHAGITLTQWRLIALIGGKDEITLTEINRATQMDKGQLSRTIKGLLGNGMIASRSSLNDQRQQLLTLTEAGRGIYHETLPKMQARQRLLMDSLRPEEKTLIFSAIDKLELASEKTMSFPKDAVLLRTQRSKAV